MQTREQIRQVRDQAEEKFMYGLAYKVTFLQLDILFHRPKTGE